MSDARRPASAGRKRGEFRLLNPVTGFVVGQRAGWLNVAGEEGAIKTNPPACPSGSADAPAWLKQRSPVS